MFFFVSFAHRVITVSEPFDLFFLCFLLSKCYFKQILVLFFFCFLFFVVFFLVRYPYACDVN